MDSKETLFLQMKWVSSFLLFIFFSFLFFLLSPHFFCFCFFLNVFFVNRNCSSSGINCVVLFFDDYFSNKKIVFQVLSVPILFRESFWSLCWHWRQRKFFENTPLFKYIKIYFYSNNQNASFMFKKQNMEKFGSKMYHVLRHYKQCMTQ